jgi:hypothetical protein
MLTTEQEKAVKSLERALNKAGKAGLSGGVYEGRFVVFDSMFSREQSVADILQGNCENGTSLSSPSISLDGGEG